VLTYIYTFPWFNVISSSNVESILGNTSLRV